MKAIYISAPGKVEFREIERPVPKAGEALLRILYGGICGSDLSSYRGRFAYFSYPRIPGHEFSAEIVEIGENSQGLRPGMVVTCNPYFNCGHCYSCTQGHVNACMDNQTMGCQRDGAFSQYITMPVERIYDGRGISPMILAAIEPLCISYHGVQRAGVRPGDKVLIIGAGTIGVLAANTVKSLGGEVYLADIVPERLEYARKAFGIDGTILSAPSGIREADVKEITGTARVNGKEMAFGFDICIEAVGVPSTFQSCIDGAAFGGKVVLLGVGKENLDFNFTMLQKKELNVMGSRNALKKDFLELIDLVKRGDINLDKIITNVYPAREASQAFQELDQSGARMLKVMLDFTDF